MPEIDQVYRPEKEIRWNASRADFWRKMSSLGLDRCLFGLESGVDSVLRRFNKHTTADQNAMGTRTLTALSVPIRLTYITFDPLMSLAELTSTYQFLGRTDLLLRGAPDLSGEAVASLVHDEGFVESQSTGRPLYEDVSYMLVSMECLVGSPYLSMVEQSGLTRGSKPSMGTVEARYLDWRIGVASDWGQRWVDRNFSFDYLLKSLEKIVEPDSRPGLRHLRVTLKASAYSFLGAMIGLIGEVPLADEAARSALLREKVELVASRQMDSLAHVLQSEVSELVLPEERTELVRVSLEKWRSKDRTWDLINEGSCIA